MYSFWTSILAAFCMYTVSRRSAFPAFCNYVHCFLDVVFSRRSACTLLLDVLLSRYSICTLFLDVLLSRYSICTLFLDVSFSRHSTCKKILDGLVFYSPGVLYIIHCFWTFCFASILYIHCFLDVVVTRRSIGTLFLGVSVFYPPGVLHVHSGRSVLSAVFIDSFWTFCFPGVLYVHCSWTFCFPGVIYIYTVSGRSVFPVF